MENQNNISVINNNLIINNTIDFKNLPNRSLNDGIQYIASFENGYGASIVKHSFSYGGKYDKWELGVLDKNGLTYETPITSDVLGYLTEKEVNDLLLEISKLPNYKED